jgi:DegV family protein with EDD domain
MKPVTIIVGQSSSIPLDIVEKYNMYLLPFTVDWAEGEGVEGKTIFEKMRNVKKQGLKTHPKTSQPSMGAYKKAYDEIIAKDNDIVCITISSKISGTYNSAVQGKKMTNEDAQKRIFIVDSLNADASEALLAIKAAELAKQGLSAEEISKAIDISKVHLFGMLESPRWLEAGGRISSTVAGILESAQKIGLRPILGIKDGLIHPTTVKMKAKDTAEALFKELQGLKNPKLRIGISHGDNLEEALRLEKMIKENLPESKIDFISMTSFVIGAHVGPGAVIVCALED